MKTKNLLFIIFFIYSYTTVVFSQINNESQIIGKITNAHEKIIRIGENTIPVSETGIFTFTGKIKYPMLYNVSYGKLTWVVYLEPNRKTELKINSDDLSSLEYNGDLISSNNFLKKTSMLNQPVNDSFFKLENIVLLYSKDKVSFISTIDSLRKVYLKPLSLIGEDNARLPDTFIDLFKADIDFKINNLFLLFPFRHWWVGITHEKVILSKSDLDGINSETIDNIALFDLSSYKEFCKTWIDYNTENLATKNIDHKNYYLKKMDAVLEYLPKIFSNYELLDYWLSEYLSDFIQKNGMANSEKYVKDFCASCKTEVYRARIEKQCSSILEGQKDHIVKTYKMINGYNLQAHIFYPNDFKKGEKRPAILVFFGGGWDDGNVTWAFGNAKQYSNLGMIGIAVQYRLSNLHRDITPIDAMQDAKDLMIWLRINSDSLGIISNKIAGSGWSAGGHLIASSAVFADTLVDKKINSMPDVLLLTCPALDAGHDEAFNKLLSETGVDPLSLSPVEHVYKGLPPTIIFAGREDHVVPLKGVQLFHDKMVADGNYSELCIYDNVGHLFTPSYLDDRGWPRPDKEIQKQADVKAVEFLKKFGFISE